MKIKLYKHQKNEKEIIYYILCSLVYISTFFIGIKLVSVNITFSFIIYCILSLIAVMYFFNINKYSIFKYDIISFMLIFYCFSGIYITKVLFNLWKDNLIYYGNIFLIISVILLLTNSIILVLKISRMSSINNTRIFLILCSYLFATVFFIITFACLYVNTVNVSIKDYIQNNFTHSNNVYIYKSNNKLNNYLSYSTGENSYASKVFNQKSFNKEQLNSYISIIYNPVDNIIDYVLFSSQNYFSGSQNNIVVHGDILKIIIIFQKLISIIITIITLVSLIDVYKLKEDNI